MADGRKKNKADGSAIGGSEKAELTSVRSRFVTDGALLGIKSIGRDAKHIVALDAHAVDDRAYDRATLGWLVQAS